MMPTDGLQWREDRTILEGRRGVINHHLAAGKPNMGVVQSRGPGFDVLIIKRMHKTIQRRKRHHIGGLGFGLAGCCSRDQQNQK